MYVVKKPLNLGGKRRIVGETLRDDEVTSPALVRSGYVAKIDSGLLDMAEAVAEPLRPFEGGKCIDIPIVTKDGGMVISVYPEAIGNAVRLLQTNAEDTAGEISVSEDEDMLIILDACDSRKKVKEAARRRAEELRNKDREGDA